MDGYVFYWKDWGDCECMLVITVYLTLLNIVIYLLALRTACALGENIDAEASRCVSIHSTFARKSLQMGNRETSQHWSHTLFTTIEPLTRATFSMKVPVVQQSSVNGSNNDVFKIYENYAHCELWIESCTPAFNSKVPPCLPIYHIMGKHPLPNKTTRPEMQPFADLWQVHSFSNIRLQCV